MTILVEYVQMCDTAHYHNETPSISYFLLSVAASFAEPGVDHGLKLKRNQKLNILRILLIVTRAGHEAKCNCL